jgi:hypothetical protein
MRSRPAARAPVPPLPRGLDDGPGDPTRARRLGWATLMKRAYAIDVLVWPKCAGNMSIIAIITDQRIAVQILDHLGVASRAPPRGRSRRPGQQQFAFDQAGGDFDGINPPSLID